MKEMKKPDEKCELTVRHELQLAVAIPKNRCSMDCTLGSKEKMMLNPCHLVLDRYVKLE